jgi:hypothetical protein
MTVEVEWLEPLVIGPLLTMVVIWLVFLLVIGKSHETEIGRSN